MGGSRYTYPLIEDYLGRRARIYNRERAILVGVFPPDFLAWQEWMDELRALATTLGVEVVGELVQRRHRPDPATFLGRGKVDELLALARKQGAEVAIVADELSPAQARNLEERTGLKVVDRTQLILDIFAEHAGTKEADLAVELAQLEYLLPRLRGWGKALTDPGGGVGTTGPGETRLEEDRRLLRRRIQSIRRQLSEVNRARLTRRRRRGEFGPPQVAIVGYTNSGKSTLFNRLTGDHVLVEDKLFSTLSTRVRRCTLPGRRKVLVADTVGFIRKLPVELIPAFLATLESVREADLLLVVLDSASPYVLDHLRTVREVIARVFQDCAPPPILYVLNKADLIKNDQSRAILHQAKLEATPAVVVSALTGENLDSLREAMAAALPGRLIRVWLRVPFENGGLLNWLLGLGKLEKIDWDEEGAVVCLSLPETDLPRLRARMGFA